MTFTIPACLFGLVQIGMALGVLCILPRHPNLWRHIPREQYIGSILGLICLIWSAYHGSAMLEGNLARLRVFLPLVVVVVVVVSFFLLDYLFSRALGGMLLLVMNFLLHEAFVQHVPLRPVFAAVCYVFCIAGILLIAVPYRFRDYLEKSTKFPKWRIASSLAFMVGGLIAVLISVVHHAG